MKGPSSLEKHFNSLVKSGHVLVKADDEINNNNQHIPNTASPLSATRFVEKSGQEVNNKLPLDIEEKKIEQNTMKDALAVDISTVNQTTPSKVNSLVERE